MYETHFGLKRRPFRALALGNDVFIGPQTAATMAGVKKALTTPDGIVAVSGPVGGGKTTVVGRALDGVGTQRVSIPVGRIKLGHDEVLELLLEELGVENLPAGTVQRFSMFRRMLKDFADRQTRVIVVVEDAARIGADSLSELEALTAADAGVSDGANVVLMGDENIDAVLDSAGLARLKQRLKLRQALAPFSAKELLAYFKHCFRLAGGDFDSVFVKDATDLIHQLSGGIPRMANNIAESAMALAAEAGLDQVTAEHINSVAAEEFGLTPIAVPAPAVSAPEMPAEVKAAGDEALHEAASIEGGQDTPIPEPAVEAEIPELIQDTLPDLAVLAPELAGTPGQETTEPSAASSEQPAVPAGVDSPEPESVHEDDIPTLSATDPAMQPGEIPAWDRDPTLAELRPDLDALEHAMAVAHGLDKEAEETEAPAITGEPVSETEAPAEVVPAITLDREIQAKIEEAAEEIKRTEEAAAAKAAADAEAEKTIDIAATGEVEVDLPPLNSDTPAPEARTEPAPAPAAEQAPATANSTGDTENLQKIASGLSRARTIDDVVDDQMAETLFGDEFSEIAAKVAAKASEGFPANDDLELVQDDAVAQAAPAADLSGAAAVSVNPAPAGPKPKLDEAAEQRLATVRALNGTPDVTPPPPPSAESIVMAESGLTAHPPAGNGESPDSIEDQINTSITQTLKALGNRPPAENDDAEDDKKGFFGRFRKS